MEDVDSHDDGADAEASDADTVETLLVTLTDRLAATAESPMRPDVTHWVAEAEAVASDVAEGVTSDAGLPDEVVRERVGHVRGLLSHVDDTGDPEADEHVTRAKKLTDDVLSALGEGN